MASAISPITSSAATQGSTAGAASALNGAAPNKELFLQLLVTQIKNQDPLHPTDSVQFVSQLAQFSELEQVIAIRGDLDTQATAAAAAAAQTTKQP